MNTGLRYLLALIIIVGVLTIIFSDNPVHRQLSRIGGQIADTVIDLYPNRSCEEPVAYALGSIDARFGLSEDALVALLKESEDIWESASGKDLFVYDPTHEEAVTINFIFDERQQDILDARASEAALTSQWNSLESWTAEYDRLSASYETQAEVYEADIREYEDLLAEFNEAVDEWNEEGGSKAEYEDLKEKEFFIKTVFKGLEKERDELNETADELNALADRINAVQAQLRRKTDLHNEKFATEEAVNSGDFGSYEINIYQYHSVPDLRLTLAHEMGHSLGIDHVDDEKAIMYFLLETQDVLKLKATQADIDGLNAACGA